MELIPPEEFDSKILKEENKVLVLFYSDKSPYCTNFKPIFEESVPETLEKKIVLLDEHDNPLWDELKINTIPTVIAFQSGKPLARKDAKENVGLTKEDMESLLMELGENSKTETYATPISNDKPKPVIPKPHRKKILVLIPVAIAAVVFLSFFVFGMLQIYSPHASFSPTSIVKNVLNACNFIPGKVMIVNGKLIHGPPQSVCTYKYPPEITLDLSGFKPNENVMSDTGGAYQVDDNGAFSKLIPYNQGSGLHAVKFTGSQSNAVAVANYTVN